MEDIARERATRGSNDGFQRRASIKQTMVIQTYSQQAGSVLLELSP